jgi:hypothetical protein
MASYTVLGHPLNYADLATTPGGAVDPGLKSTLMTNGVGKVVTLALTGGDDTKSKGHAWLK